MSLRLVQPPPRSTGVSSPRKAPPFPVATIVVEEGCWLVLSSPGRVAPGPEVAAGLGDPT